MNEKCPHCTDGTRESTWNDDEQPRALCGTCDGAGEIGPICRDCMGSGESGPDQVCWRCEGQGSEPYEEPKEG